jgi:parallel beta-helix repeat protein
MIPYGEVEDSQPPKEEREVWEINEEMVISNETLILSKDLVIGKGGKLTLDNVDLIMDNSGEFVSNIQVEKNGEFYIFNSNISVLYPEKYHDFGVHEISTLGILEIRNSSVHSFTLSIYSDEMELIDSEFSNNNITGIFIKDCSPKIIGNWIHDSRVGIQGDNANPEIKLNNISSNSDYGVYFYNHSKPNILENRFFGNSDGIRLRESNHAILENNTFSKNEQGISLFDSFNTFIIKNKFYGLTGGIRSINSEFTSVRNFFNISFQGYSLDRSYANISYDHLITKLGYGIHSRNSQLEIKNCVIDAYSSIDFGNTTAIITNNSFTGAITIEESKDVFINNNSIKGNRIQYYNDISIKSSNCIISNNEISIFRTGLYFKGESKLSIVDNVISDIESSAISFYAPYSYQKSWINLSRNTIINASVAIRSEWHNLVVKDCTILESRRYDFYLERSEIKTINSSFDENKLHIGHSTIVVENYLNLEIIDDQGVPVIANVSIYDNNDEKVHESISETNGWIKEIPLIYYTENEYERTFSKPYKLVVKDETYEIQTSVFIEKTKDVEIIFDIIGDLKVASKDIGFSKGFIEDNETTNITTIIHNIGYESVENVTVEFFIDNISIGEYFIDQISPGNSEIANINWTPYLGDVVIKVEVSTESKETNTNGNNIAKTDLHVYDFVVDSNESYVNETWEFNGDVIIAPGGVLELNNVSIIMKSIDKKILFNVTEGGELYMDKSDISAFYSFIPFNFHIYGKANLNDSRFSGMGIGYYWSSSSEGGITILSDNVIISNSSIENNSVGINCVNSSPIIYNNNIINNTSSGIYCTNSNATIVSNVIQNAGAWGVGITIEDSKTYIFNNTINANNNGIYILSSEPFIEKNTITNNAEGIQSFDSQSSINDNMIIGNGYGITESYSSSSITNNQIIENYVGIQLSWSYLTIIENLIIENEYGIFMGYERYFDDSILTIINNTISQNKKSGIDIYDTSGEIINNTIGGNGEWGVREVSGNTTYENNEYEYDGNPNLMGRILKEYLLKVRATDTYGEFIEQYWVEVFTKNESIIIDSDLRNYIGRGERYSEHLPGYALDNNGTDVIFDYIVEVEKEGFTNSTNITLDEPMEIILQLTIEPDLEISEVEVGKYFSRLNDDEDPIENDKITIEVKVYNNGTGTAFNVTVRTYIDGKLKNEQTISEIKPGRTQSISFSWIAKAGNHEFETFLDPNNTIKELDENNNKAQNKKHFEPLPTDFTPINTLLIIFLIFLILTFIFWVRWRYETWK